MRVMRYIYMFFVILLLSLQSFAVQASCCAENNIAQPCDEHQQQVPHCGGECVCAAATTASLYDMAVILTIDHLFGRQESLRFSNDKVLSADYLPMKRPPKA